MAGGFSYQDMANWDKQGRKRSGMENMSAILSSIASGAQQNKEIGMKDNLMTAKMRESGYQPDQTQEGLAGLLSRIAGIGQQYEYKGVPTTALDAAKEKYYNAKAETAGQPTAFDMLMAQSLGMQPQMMTGNKKNKNNNDPLGIR